MVENIYRRLSQPGASDGSKLDIVHEAASEVARPILFSISIIVLVLLPIFALEGVEGKMFRPLAFTISFALLGSMAVALLVAPVLSMRMLKRREQKELLLVTWLRAAYKPLLNWALRRRTVVVLLGVIAFIAALAVLPLVGTEFVPTHEEGSILIGVAMAPL